MARRRLKTKILLNQLSKKLEIRGSRPDPTLVAHRAFPESHSKSHLLSLFHLKYFKNIFFLRLFGNWKIFFKNFFCPFIAFLKTFRKNFSRKFILKKNSWEKYFEIFLRFFFSKTIFWEIFVEEFSPENNSRKILLKKYFTKTYFLKNIFLEKYFPKTKVIGCQYSVHLYFKTIIFCFISKIFA